MPCKGLTIMWVHMCSFNCMYHLHGPTVTLCLYPQSVAAGGEQNAPAAPADRFILFAERRE